MSNVTIDMEINISFLRDNPDAFKDTLVALEEYMSGMCTIQDVRYTFREEMSQLDEHLNLCWIYRN